MAADVGPGPPRGRALRCAAAGVDADVGRGRHADGRASHPLTPDADTTAAAGAADAGTGAAARTRGRSWLTQ